jgi:hypothetical protein
VHDSTDADGAEVTEHGDGHRDGRLRRPGRHRMHHPRQRAHDARHGATGDLVHQRVEDAHRVGEADGVAVAPPHPQFARGLDAGDGELLDPPAGRADRRGDREPAAPQRVDEPGPDHRVDPGGPRAHQPVVAVRQRRGARGVDRQFEPAEAGRRAELGAGAVVDPLIRHRWRSP